MLDHLLFAVTLLAALGSGLIAGNFFAFSAFLLKGLRDIPPKTGITAMQSIIAAIKTPLFFTVFFGTAALAALLGIAAPLEWHEPQAKWVLLGSLLYLNGPIGLTLMRNLPLNNSLSQVRTDSPEGAEFWKVFLSEWSTWNNVRMVMGLAAAACFTMALVKMG